MLELDAAGALTTAHVRAGARVGGVNVRTVWRWLEAARTEGRVERRPRARLELSDQAWEVLAQAGGNVAPLHRHLKAAGGMVWQEADLLLWKPPRAWFSVNAVYVLAEAGRQLRNWYVNFERPARCTDAGFDTFDLTVDLVVTADLARWEWRDEGEYAHVRCLGVVSDTEHRAVDAARGEVLAMLDHGRRGGVGSTVEVWLVCPLPRRNAWPPRTRTPCCCPGSPRAPTKARRNNFLVTVTGAHPRGSGEVVGCRAG
ncbi:DUF402 domain-containing protein [Streptomyces sp. NPDC056149]|uniref:DUF402 domain-containing protein n=1 Tax=Streptomyces sp. NPDC056149 TaxID=3345728 RepID=UPI0035DB22DA